MTRRKGTFGCVRSEGGLLFQDMLMRVQASAKDLPGTDPASYHLDPHERIGEAVNRAWLRLTGAWRSFQQALALSKEPERSPATGLTRDRWLLPLFQELGYGRLPKAAAIELEGRSYPLSHLWNRSPIHLVGAGVDLDKRQPGVAGAARLSPHGLVQDFLNRSDDHLWGFVSNGSKLRVLRDHHSLTRQSYLEFDVQTMMDGELYSEFLLLWMVCHESRVEVEGEKRPEDCWLEKWLVLSRDEGVRALDKLRGGVERAIEALGTGFMKHGSNAALRTALRSGELDAQEYFRQILRLVYRVIFLFVAEERGLLLDPAATDEAKDRYTRFYAARRLRDLAERRRGGPHGDLWRGLKLVMERLDGGCAELALPALGSRLWSSSACPWLMGAECSNEHVLTAIRNLSAVQEGTTRHSVSWRNVGAEELGSIYESLLEQHPRLNEAAGTFELDTAAGHERKTTGSYYTPSSLVDCLLDTALDPVLDEAAKKPEPEKAILDLKVCDPACGSGHFLVAAARRIAKRLAVVRSGEEEPSPVEVQRALRDVVGRCIFGVDLNPMAVELCKVSLWMEAMEPGRPLSFLDSHVQTGNSLLGATPALMARGIPDEAFEAITGDDKAVAKRLKKRNRDERKGQETLFDLFVGDGTTRDGEVVKAKAGQIDAAPDADIAAVRRKASEWDLLTRSPEYRDAWFRADAWCASFVWPKQTRNDEDSAVTEGLWRRIKTDVSVAPQVTRKTVRELAKQYRFFHWHLAFPQVFGAAKKEFDEDETTGWTGGFDVVLGNPPWERVKLQEQEFFAPRNEAIATAPNAAARKKLIAALPQNDPTLWADWVAASREAEGQSHCVRNSGRFSLCGQGDVNTYAVFAEHNRAVLGRQGRAGFIVPTGIATDDTTKEYFGALVDGREIVSFFSFENEQFVFPSVHHAFKFALLTVARDGSTARADLVFFARQLPALSDPDRHFSLTPEDFALLNPNTRTCPTFRSRRDAEINKAIYRKAGVLQREGDPEGDPWLVKVRTRLWHMAEDSEWFRSREDLLTEGWQPLGSTFVKGGEVCVPLLEAKMVHHFDHRFGTYEGQSDSQSNQGKLPELDDATHADPLHFALPYYWVPRQEVETRLRDIWSRSWLLGWRDICRSTDQRSVIASVVPKTAVGHTMPIMVFGNMDGPNTSMLYANLCSFALDYGARQKIGGTHLTLGFLCQLPILTPAAYDVAEPWSTSTPLRNWLMPRVLELTYTAWDLEPFAKDCGYDGAPFRWDRSRRFWLRAELDAAFFHLYGIGRDDVDYIMETFPIVRRNDKKAHGTYRTKEAILDIYDRMQRAIDTGVAYQTVLEPGPADTGVAHEDTRARKNTSNRRITEEGVA